MNPQKAQPAPEVPDPRAFVCDGISWTASGRQVPVPAWLNSVRASSTLVNLGQRGWRLLGANRPEGSGAWASACLVGTRPGQERAPVVQGFTISAKNLYGTPVIRIVWQMELDAAAGDDTVQVCLGRLQAQSVSASIAAGWKVDLSLSTSPAVEALAPEGVIAVLPVRVDLSLSSALKTETRSQDYLVTPRAVYTR